MMSKKSPIRDSLEAWIYFRGFFGWIVLSSDHTAIFSRQRECGEDLLWGLPCYECYCCERTVLAFICLDCVAGVCVWARVQGISTSFRAKGLSQGYYDSLELDRAITVTSLPSKASIDVSPLTR